MTLLHKQASELIVQAQNILLLTDERIDGDTIGSTLGMYHMLKEMGKRVRVFSPKEMIRSLAFLPGANDITRDTAVFDDRSVDLMLIFDCSDGVYIHDVLPALKHAAPLVVFDHHASNPRYGTINIIEEDAASTADVVWRFAKQAGLPVNQEAAQCILTGICTDTNLFLTSNTTAACLDAAHELTRLGARLQQIVKETMMNKSVASLKLWGVAFSRLFHHDGIDGIATVITRKDLEALQTDDEEAKSLSNFLGTMLDGADVVMVLRETDDGAVKGSLRGHTRDVKAIAEKYGGGGHIKAAGFKIPDAHLEEKDGKWFVRKADGTIVALAA